MAKPKKYYAVARGAKPGIYQTWYGAGGAEEQVRGFTGARYKGFATRQEAEEWLKSPASASAVSTPRRKKEATPDCDSQTEIVVYTDGSALNNPGSGGYGVVIQMNGNTIQELSGGYRFTTNNRMELLACIRGLDYFKKKQNITLFSDSKYVVDGITKGWARSWRRRGWKKSNGDPALNPDLWKKLLELTEFHSVNFRWVKGHAGNPGNERCDVLANAEAAKSGLPIDQGYQNNKT